MPAFPIRYCGFNKCRKTLYKEWANSADRAHGCAQQFLPTIYAPFMRRSIAILCPGFSPLSASQMPAAKKHFHLHLVSDSTGETLIVIAKAVCALFEAAQAEEHVYGLVRSPKQLQRVLDRIAACPGPVLYSLVNPELHRALEKFCRARNLPNLSALAPFIALLGEYLHTDIQARPGRQHALDKEYFARMDALDYTMRHDDGQNQDELNQADVILVGASRTSKTPTCIYLANRGVKAANVPLVAGQALLTDLSRLPHPLIVGLTAHPERLVQIRKHRVLTQSGPSPANYVHPDEVRREMLGALRLFKKHGWPVIDVSRRSIEETAAEIMNLYTEHAAPAAPGRAE